MGTPNSAPILFMSNPWSEKESKDRIDKFEKEYKELVKKYDCDYVAYPQYIPTGQTGFTTITRMVPIDLRQQNVPSPLQKGSIIA